MKVTGMVIALVAGVLALIVGVFVSIIGAGVGAIGSELGDTSANAKATLMIIISLGLPILCIVGGALVPTKTTAATILTTLPGAALVIFALTSDPVLTLLLVLGGLMILAAIFIWIGAKNEATAAGSPTA